MENLESVSSSSAVADVLQNGFASHTRTHAEILARDYEIKNPEQVAEFIGENLFLLDLLEEIPVQIRQVFGDQQNLKLEFFFDPEDSSWNKLHIYIPTKFKSQESRNLLEKFSENLLFDNEMRTSSKIFINLRFVK